MLVLSRRQNERIVFPNLGIRIQVIRVSGKVVKVGIDAPSDILVLREEVADSHGAMPDIPGPTNRRLRHALRNRLNTAALGLQVLHRKIEEDRADDAEPLIFKVFEELREVERDLDREKKAESEHRGVRRRRALIVEDNANEGNLLAELLRLSGYDVDLVDDGSQAITYLSEQDHPDVVLLDMCMPQMDGRETVTSIRSRPAWRGLKVFAVSGANPDEVAVECGPGGVDRWFTKPVDARHLVGEMNRDLDDASVSA